MLRLVAVLRVVKRFESHEVAADWYRGQGLVLPSNCLVEGNAPIPLEQTDGWHSSLDAWDRLYRAKVRQCPIFLACRPIFRELTDPPIVTEQMLMRSFGRIPATRTPPVVPIDSIRHLMAEVGAEARLRERI